MKRLDAVMGIAVAASSLFGQVERVRACSVPESEVLPSNFGLAEMADAVILAEAARGEPRDRVLVPDPGVSRTYREGVPGCVKFTILETLKGTVPKDLCLAGRIAEATGIEMSWTRPRQGALSGACVAFDYAVGHKYLLLLKTSGPEPMVLSPPFARVNEEVSGRGDPWVVGIERYIAISKLPTFEAKVRALRDLRAQAQPESELHKDITRFLDHPWPGKPASALVAYLAPGTDIPETRRALYLLAGQSPEQSRQAVDDLLASPRAQQLAAPLAEYAVKHGLSAYWRRLVEVVLSSPQEPEWHFQNLLAANIQHVTAEQAIGVALKCLRPTCERSFDLNTQLLPIVRLHVGTDYAVHRDESLLLAELGDPAVASWAEGLVAASTGGGEEAGLAFEILARSSRGEKREFLVDAYCNHRTHLSSVLQGYRAADWWGRKDRAAELAVTPGLKVKEKNALLDLLRYWTRAEPGGESKSVAYVLRENVEKGVPPDSFFFKDVMPLTCGR